MYSQDRIPRMPIPDVFPGEQHSGSIQSETHAQGRIWIASKICQNNTYLETLMIIYSPEQNGTKLGRHVNVQSEKSYHLSRYVWAPVSSPDPQSCGSFKGPNGYEGSTIQGEELGQCYI